MKAESQSSSGGVSAAECRLQWKKRNAPMAWNLIGAEIFQRSELTVPSQEQEIIIQTSRDAYTSNISCSHVPWITKLKKNPAFVVEKIYLAHDGRILQVEGCLPVNLLSLRSKSMKAARDDVAEVEDDQ